MPVKVKWGSQFSIEERQNLQDRYSLPETFLRMSFATISNQRDAITKMNGKHAGYRGPRLLVQRYIPEAGPAVKSNDGSMIRDEDKAQSFLVSKAEMFHRKIQSEEEQRNRNCRLGIAIEGSDNMSMVRDRDMDIYWDGDDESDYKNERSQLTDDEEKEISYLERIDSSGMSFYD